jgi:A/G-specific adenine glycosylase
MSSLLTSPAPPAPISTTPSPAQVSEFRESLLAWYRAHARDLPWRRTRDPYRIWISEIMLQQTRVAAVIDHYARFTARFPDVHALAAASEADVLAQWSGLGYYRRARMMHRAAQTVVAEHAGQFPRTAEALLTLPGIGAYTAAAIASIAFGEPVAVVDGNVERVLTRIAALDQSPALSAIRKLADTLIDPEHPSHFNQAMMELGATVCLPRAPLCLQCPVQSLCQTRGEHKTTPRPRQQPRDAFYALVERDKNGSNEILLEQRPHTASLMAGMWQLPELSSAPENQKPLCTVKHAITVTNYTVRIFAHTGPLHHDWPKQWVPQSEASKLPLTGLARKVLKKLRSSESPVGEEQRKPGQLGSEQLRSSESPVS